MSSSQKLEQKLNSSELKSQLYHSLQQKGVLDAMKLQLRNRLVKELKQTSTVPRSLSVLESLTHGIILEHLQKMGYEYTISLFALESGMGAYQSINSTELMKLLKIDAYHPLYKSFMDDSKVSEQGFLTTLLLSLPQLASLQRTTASVGTQVEVPAVEESTGQKSHHAHLSLEQRILAFEKECEERSQKAMEEKISQFKNGELLRVKMESKENFKKELHAKRTELEQQYQEKIEQVSKKERDMVQRLQRREEELEASLYSQRQLVLQELELIRQREDHLIKQSELNKLQFSDLHSTSEQLKQDEKILKTEVTRKQELLDQLQNQLAARTTEVSTVRQQYEDLWKECTSLRNVLISSKEEVHTATEQLISLQTQKLQLEQKLKEGENYDQLKDENRKLKNELTDNKHKLSEYSSNSGRLITDQQQLICELKEQLHKLAVEPATLQQQLDTAQVEYKQALMLKDLHIKRLEHQLTAQVSVNQRMSSHEQLCTPHRQLHSVVSKNILKSSPPKLGKTSKPRTSKSARQLQPLHSDTDDSLSTTHTRSRVDLKEDLSSFDRASKKFLEEMKETFLRLEREAKELEEQHPTDGYHLPNISYPSIGYTNPLSSHQWQDFSLTKPHSLPNTIFTSSATQPPLNIPTNFNMSTFAAVPSNNWFTTSINYGLTSASSVTSNPYSSHVMSNHSYTSVSLSHRPVMSVTIPHPSTTLFQPIHLPTTSIHLPAVTVTTQGSLVNILSPLTTSATLTHPLTTVATLSHPLTTVATLTHPLTTVATLTHPLTTVTTLTHPLTTVATLSHPLTTVATLTHPLTTVATLTHPLTTVTTLTHLLTSVTLPSVTSSVTHATIPQFMINNSVPQANVSASTSITYPLTSETNTLTASISTLTGLTTTAACLKSATPLVKCPLTTNYDQASFSSITTTSQGHSGSAVVTSSPHSIAAQPHLMSTTTIQEDSLTANSSGMSETTEDDGESPRSTKEGTLAAVLALRNQYSPGLSSLTTVSQQPPIISLDHLWSSKGDPTVEKEKELRTEQVDEADKTNETITHQPDASSMLAGHTSLSTVTTGITTPTQSLHPVVTTTSAVQTRSLSPPGVTADVTSPSQSLDNTMGRYLQLLQQKQQAEENSPPTATHNTDKEEESAVTYDTPDNGGKISDDGFEDW